MTASELADRKKELSENFTIEELIDLYLASEHSLSDAIKKNKELNEENALLVAKNDAINKIPGEYDNRHQDDCIRINQLNVALDIVMEKYIRLKGFFEV